MKKLSLRKRYELESDPQIREEIAEVIEKRRDTRVVKIQNLFCMLFAVYMFLSGVMILSDMSLQFAWNQVEPLLVDELAELRPWFAELFEPRYVHGFFDLLFKMFLIGTVASTAAASGIVKREFLVVSAEHNKKCLSFVYQCSKLLMSAIAILPFFGEMFEISFAGTYNMLIACTVILLLNAMLARVKSYKMGEKRYLNHLQFFSGIRVFLGGAFYLFILVTTILFNEIVPITYGAVLQGDSDTIYAVMTLVWMGAVLGVVTYTFDNFSRFACVCDKKRRRLGGILHASINLVLIAVPLFWLVVEIWQIAIFLTMPLLMLVVEIVSFFADKRFEGTLLKEDIEDIESGKTVEILSERHQFTYEMLK